MTNRHDVAASTQEPLEAAAITLDAFAAKYPMDARLMLKLLYLCDNKTAQAMVLWDALKQHHSVKKIDVWLPQSTSAYLKRYPKVSVGSVSGAISDLVSYGLLFLYAGAPNTKRQIKLNLSALISTLDALEDEFKRVPGLEY
jgi:hypothetical protein